MDATKITSEKYIISNGDYKQRKTLMKNLGCEYVGDNYYGEPVYERVLHTEPVHL